MRIIKTLACILLVPAVAGAQELPASPVQPTMAPRVQINTNLGPFVMELDRERADFREDLALGAALENARRTPDQDPEHRQERQWEDHGRGRAQAGSGRRHSARARARWTRGGSSGSSSSRSFVVPSPLEIARLSHAARDAPMWGAVVATRTSWNAEPSPRR